MMFALSILGSLRSAAKALLAFAASHPWQAVCIALIALSAWFWHGKGKALEARNAEITSHKQTKVNYRTAQDEAKLLEIVRLDRVKQEQQEITDAARQIFNVRIAAARAKYERVRLSREAASGSSSGVAVSGVPVTPAGADEAPDDFGLHARFVASTQALQLAGLISWNERQAGIDPNE